MAGVELRTRLNFEKDCTVYYHVGSESPNDPASEAHGQGRLPFNGEPGLMEC